MDSTQIVARASLPGDFRIVAVARLLGISASEAEKCLQVDLGDTVHRGDVIARRRGPLGQVVESPIDGMVTTKGGGGVVIEGQPVPFELRAYIPGRVMGVEHKQVVSIETAGALIQGSWGSGEEGIGPLRVVADNRGHLLRSKSIDTSCQGSVLVAGRILDPDALVQAQDVELRGLVTGGLSPALLDTVDRLPFPVVVTDGLGDLPMMRGIFDLLERLEGSETSISGRIGGAGAGTRPEIIIPKPASEPPAAEPNRRGELTLGARVRIVRAPRLGSTGTVVGIPRQPRRTATGARAYCAEVDIGQEEAVLVPVVNLEILR